MSRNQSSAERDRYDELEMADGQVVIYDTDNHRAWIQSDTARDPDEMA